MSSSRGTAPRRAARYGPAVGTSWRHSLRWELPKSCRPSRPVQARWQCEMSRPGLGLLAWVIRPVRVWQRVVAPVAARAVPIRQLVDASLAGLVLLLGGALLARLARLLAGSILGGTGGGL